MISVIICSTNDILFRQVSESIEKTLKMPYEIIKIDNSSNKFGICKAYNDGARKAKFPFLCFLHEDVIFETDSWGEELVQFFNHNKDAGIVGIAGSNYKSLVPSVWAQGLFDTDHIHIIQKHPDKNTIKKISDKSGYEEVKTLDGVFLFTKKEVWESNKFDEQTFDKFHCYDLDFCLQIGLSHKIFVCYDILLQHLSAGKLNRDWVNYSIKLSEKWRKVLPVGNLTNYQRKEIEWRNRKIFFFRMNILGFPFLTSLKVFLKWNFFRNFSLFKTAEFLKDIVLRKLKLSDRPFY